MDVSLVQCPAGTGEHAREATKFDCCAYSGDDDGRHQSSVSCICLVAVADRVGRSCTVAAFVA